MRLFGVNLGQKIENHLVQKSLEHAKRFYFSESLSLTARFCENLRPMPLFVLSAYAGSILSFLRSFLPIMYQLGQKKNKLKIVFVFHSFKIKKNEFKIKNFVFFYHCNNCFLGYSNQLRGCFIIQKPILVTTFISNILFLTKTWYQ